MSVDRNSPENESNLKDQSSNTSDAISPDLNAIQTEMTKMREDIKKLQWQNTIVLNNNQELKESIKFLKDELYNAKKVLRRDLIEVDAKQRHLSRDMEILESSVNEINYDETISTIEDCIDNLEKEMKENEVEIYGLYKLSRENLIKAVMRIGQEINCPVLPSDIYKCYRKRSNVRGKIGNVIVKFHDLTKRNDFLLAYQNFGNSTDVTVKVPLTTRNINLLQMALESREENGYKFVFDKNGEVYMQMDEWSSLIHVKSESDIP